MTVIVRATATLLGIDSGGESLAEGTLYRITNLINRRSVNRGVGIAAQPTVHPVLKTTIVEACVAITYSVHVITACNRINAERCSLCGLVCTNCVEDHPSTGRPAEVIIRLPGPGHVEIVGLFQNSVLEVLLLTVAIPVGL